jgi:diamine N-acetyltransferase
MLSDLDFVVSVENDPANLPFITSWERTQHEGAVRSIELKRLVLQRKGVGQGRHCVRLLKHMAFSDLRAHRFWLDVKALNTRAQSLYASEGFIEEGRLRESVRLTLQGADGYDSLIVMSLLDREYQARVALGLESLAPA